MDLSKKKTKNYFFKEEKGRQGMILLFEYFACFVWRQFRYIDLFILYNNKISLVTLSLSKLFWFCRIESEEEQLLFISFWGGNNFLFSSKFRFLPSIFITVGLFWLFGLGVNYIKRDVNKKYKIYGKWRNIFIFY